MFANILVASDFSQASQAATICGCELAGKLDASVHLIHVVGNPAALPWTAEAFAVPLTDLIPASQDEARQGLLLSLPREYRPAVTISTPVGTPSEEILKYAKAHHVDLIVMGSRGQGALEHFVLGSVAERVVRHAPCAVLTVPQAPHSSFFGGRTGVALALLTAPPGR